jgi:hypothetical protein
MWPDAAAAGSIRVLSFPAASDLITAEARIPLVQSFGKWLENEATDPGNPVEPRARCVGMHEVR